MKRFYFYHRTSGAFHPHWFMTDDARQEVLAANTPADHVALEGEYDPASQRIDISLEERDEQGALKKHGPVVDFVPHQPSEDHEWDAGSRRWRLRPEAEALRLKHMTARAQIAALETRQPRAVREAVLGRPGAMERLEELDAQIAAARAALSRE